MLDENKRVIEELSDSKWFLFVLLRGQSIRHLLPFPVSLLLKFLFPDKAAVRPAWSYSSLWMTLSLGTTAVTMCEPSIRGALHAQVNTISSLLFQGVLLITALIGITVAIPGESLLQKVVKGQPTATYAYLEPYVWGFLWGVIGACVALAASQVAPWSLPRPIVSLGVWAIWYGTFYVLNTMLLTLQRFGQAVWHLSQSE